MSFIFKYNRTQRNKAMKQLFAFYGITLAINILIALLLPERSNLTLVSLLPAILTLSLIGLAYQTSDRTLKGMYAPTLSEADPNFSKTHIASNLISQYVCLLCVPACFPFIFFFSNTVKLYAFFIIFAIPFFFVFVLGVLYNLLWIKMIKKQNVARQREREEAERREEEMDWNDYRK